MVTSTELFALVARERVIPIIRSNERTVAVRIGRALIEAGFGALEISLTSPDALDGIAELAALGTAQIGAGTVLTRQDVANAQAAGASFLVTPAVTESLAESVARGLPVLAGALTPTEILAAWSAGATAVKLFPAEFGGPAYLSALRAPFPDIPLIPVGGVTVESARDYLRRGAPAVGVGSPLTGRATDTIDEQALSDRANAFMSLRDLS
ncbi:aldolase [Microbacterium nanhaiense]|uniref:Aldolase n=1 Tax=Microbacterium nanhaiense TaxID=1301026 RepID=A0ABQ2N4I9_9MICO|nr:bifunctional 4-hydroxy-2-oxoglutarate aldolase/2-dehydro-3-deoxy-phosphogluconate aldolase [Microbacterium nanhaiense]GGO66371.1 aldolase [Microbacterium nanhaiense]